MEPFCPYFHHAVELIGRRWSGAILRALRTGVSRFSELTATVPGLSDRMLSERLKELEAEGIVERRVIAETPVRIDYLLTEKGRALSGVMDAISAWATRWHDDGPSQAHDCAESAAATGRRRGRSRQPDSYDAR
ncbi:MAG: helix-turn-helix transcriptional regulator [Dehalococcoidia bacterium]|nr:helix-turn-helix transcriptional regulator [Dehalococcoidia bacterium]